MARLIAKTTSTAADTAGDEIDAVPLERWLEVPPPRQELTYDGLLSEVGIADKKEELGEYLSNGSELVELSQMDEEDLSDDILDDPDLGLAAEVKARFRAQVAELKGGKEEGTEQTASQPDAALALKEAAGLADDEEDEQTVGVGEMQQRIDAAVATSAAAFEARLAELEARLALNEGVPPP